MIVIKAVIMAGGEGTRLRPLTCEVPKPMVPILNKPVMEYAIKLLRKHDIKDIAVTLAYLPAVITDYFGDGKDRDVRLNYFIEEVPLGTGGSVKNADKFLDNTFVVVSGDALTDIDLSEAVRFHRDKASKATLVLKKESIPLEYGVIITDEQSRIIRFLEKPSWGEVFSDTINTGIYILEPDILEYYNAGDNFDFSKDLFPKLLEDGVPMYGYVTEDYWSDIGDLNSYKQAQYDLLGGKVKLEIECAQAANGIWIEDGANIDGDVRIEAPVYIGKNSVIKGPGSIEALTVIGENCEIEKKTSIKKSILWKNVRLGKNCQLRGAVICSGAGIKNNVHLFEDAVVGSGSTISDRVTVKPGIKIWPEKKVEEGTVLVQNLVWGTKGTKTLFGFRDVTGDINIDITPEFASRIGSAFATLMKEDATVVVSSDFSMGAELVRNSLISGIQSTGISVIDIENAITPVNRFAVTYYRADGSIHVRANHYDANRIHIEFCNQYGANIDRNIERKIENLFNRDDFERCNSDRVKSIIKIKNFISLYVKDGAAMLKNKPEIRSRSPRVVLSSRSTDVIGMASRYLESIGCRVESDYSLNRYPATREFLGRMARRVTEGDAEMGIIMGENGENLILIDEKGRIIEGEKYIALICLMLLKMGEGGQLIVPYIAPQIIEKMAENYGIKVIRTKSAPSSIMDKMLRQSSTDRSSYLQYILNFDVIWGIGIILDFLSGAKTTLGGMVNELPDFYYLKKEIKCDWKDKGRIIREIVSANRDDNIEMFEGVKISDERGWALMLPDSERPVFNVYTEALTEEFAQELSVFFVEKIKSLIKNNG